MPEKFPELNWRKLTKKYQKEQVILYLLTIASALLASINDQNSATSLTEKIRGNEEKLEFKIFSQVIIGEKGWLGNWFQGGMAIFQLFMLALVILYCLIVIAHVFYAYYLENKINRSLRTQLMKKFLRLQGSYNKKDILNLFHNDLPRFTYNVMFVPNQIFYLVVSTIFNFLGVIINTKNDKNPNYSPVWVGLIYSLVTLGVVSFLQYVLYWADLKFQKKLARQVRKEDVIINNRELIIKKDLVDDTYNSYQKIVNWTQDEADHRSWVYTLSWVIPAFSLTPYYDFFLLIFLRGTGTSTLLTTKLFGKIFGGIKKMVERLRDYPYYFSARQRINQFLAQPERDDIQKNLLIPERITSITFQQVCFAYQAGQPVLEQSDLTWKQGKVNRLTGPNGSGKSTRILLALGLTQPTAGEILINHKYKLSEINLIAWRKKIAYAEHNNLIANGLSTGQKQLADLNNLFAVSPAKEIFIFDEADNALDTSNRQEFRKKITALSKEKLVIWVSH